MLCSPSTKLDGSAYGAHAHCIGRVVACYRLRLVFIVIYIENHSVVAAACPIDRQITSDLHRSETERPDKKNSQ